MIEKRILLTGASGLLGKTVYRYLTDPVYQKKYPISPSHANSEFDWNCLGLCHSQVKENMKQIDLTDSEQVDNLISEYKPNVILHCAAKRRVEYVDNNFEASQKLNKDATAHLAKVSAQLGIFFIYISSDYVFDGTKPPYKIDDEPNPINKYGITKLGGEKATLNASPDHCIVRVPLLYGLTEVNRFDESGVNVLIENVRKQQPYKVDNVQLRFPTHCIDVARFCANLIQKRFQDESGANKIKGVFHCSGTTGYTKFEIACMMADLYNLPKDHIQPDMSEANKTALSLRPDNVQLDTVYSFATLDFQPILELKYCIKECLEVFV